MDIYEQRLVIAEACGYVRPTPEEQKHHGLAVGVMYNAPKEDERRRYGFVPDYPRDLNAMFMAESHLREDQWSKYIRELHFVWSRTRIDARPTAMKQTIHATCQQRCEALLRTIGKWAEEPPCANPPASQPPTPKGP